MAKPKIQPKQNPQNSPQPRPSVVSTQQWSGPLPPPGALEHFDRLIPNGAERIMRMVEQEQAHRIKHEQDGLAAAIKDTKRGHWIGGTISVMCAAGSVYTAYIGAHPLVSIALVGVPISSVINAILKSRSK